MNYDSEKIGRIILSERKKRSWTQAKVGKEIGVAGKQISNYENGKLTPPIDILLALCSTFRCELGYLLGEEDYSEGTKLETAITKSTGLDVNALKNIRAITGENKESLEFGCDSESYRSLLNKLLATPSFIGFIECLHDLDTAFTDYKNILFEVEKRIGKARLSEALELYNSPISYDPGVSVLESEQYEAISIIDSVIDRQRTLTYSIKIARYELHEAFESLIESLYPRIEKPDQID